MAKRRRIKNESKKNDDFDDFDDIDDGDDGYGDELEALRPASANVSRRLAARRAIELAREELALRRELEDYLD